MGRGRRRAPVIGMRGRHTRYDGHRASSPLPRLAAAWLAAMTRPAVGALRSVRRTGAERWWFGWLGYVPACPAEQAAPLAAFLT